MALPAKVLANPILPVTYSDRSFIARFLMAFHGRSYNSMALRRRIPGYPRIDRGNDYLMARFDGAVLDAQPWGRGDAVPLPPSAVHLQTHTMARWQQQLEVDSP